MGRFTGLIGLIFILAAAFALSRRRRAIKLNLLAWGLGLQFAFAILVLKTDFGRVFQAIGVGVNAMLEYAEAGSNFVFGPLGDWITPHSAHEGNRTIETAFGPRLVDVYMIDSRNNPEMGIVEGVYRWYLGVNNRIVYLAEIDLANGSSQDYVARLVESNIAWV